MSHKMSLGIQVGSTNANLRTDEGPFVGIVCHILPLSNMAAVSNAAAASMYHAQLCHGHHSCLPYLPADAAGVGTRSNHDLCNLNA